MFNVTGSEIIIILLVALVVLGPDKLPDAIRRAGKLYGELRRMSDGFQSELREALDEPLRQVRDTVDMAKSGFTGEDPPTAPSTVTPPVADTSAAEGAPTPDVVPAMEAAVDEAEATPEPTPPAEAIPAADAEPVVPDNGHDGLAEHDLSVVAPAPATDDPELTAFDGLLEPDAAEAADAAVAGAPVAADAPAAPTAAEPARNGSAPAPVADPVALDEAETRPA